jgi:hypothetical protein
MESRKKGHRAKASLLGHIFGVMVVARQPARQIVGRVQVR